MSNPLRKLTIKITSFFNGLRRKSLKQDVGKIGKKTSKTEKLGNLSIIKKVITGRLFALIFAFGAFILILTVSNRFFAINFIPFDVNEESQPLIFNSSSVNLAFYGYVTSDDPGETDYRYLEIIAVISRTDNISRLYLINPSFITNVAGDQRQFSTILNLWDSEELVPNLNDVIERSLGVRIDRYVMADLAKLEGIINKTTSEDVQSMYKEILYGEDVDDQNLDSKMVLQENFLYELSKEYVSIFDKISFFWELRDLSGIIATDITRGELYIMNMIFGHELKVTGYLSTSLGNLVNLEKENLFEINEILLDDSLRKIFQDLRVVSEQCELEIYNSSNIPGFALKKTRELKNIGVNVVKYGNYFEDVEDDQHLLFVPVEEDLERYRNTISSIQQSLRGNVNIIIGEYEYNQTGDLVLVLIGE